MLICIPEIFDRDEVKQLRQHVLNGAWQEGRKTAGGIAAVVKNNRQLDTNDKTTQELSALVRQRVSSHPTFVSAALPTRFFPPKFNRYSGGETYGAHIDSSILQCPETGLSIRTDVSSTLFLNDADEYEGGELEVETPFGLQQVKLNAGDLVVYPATSLHRVAPVTEGERLASFMWVQSLVSDEAKRTMLYDLDQSIQSLSTDLTVQDERVVQLSGMYHNLLRQWAVPG